MCIEPYELDYERTDEMSVLSDFYCGVDEMDNYIHNHLERKIKEDGNAESFIIRKDGEIVAMTSVVRKGLELKIENEEYCFDSLEIEYLAVRKDFQRNGIGKQVIDWIEQAAKEKYPTIDYLTVCAYVDHDSKYTAEPFYAHCGFFIIKKPHPMMNYVKMAKEVK